MGEAVGRWLVCERPGCGAPYGALASPPWDLACGHGLCGPCCAAALAVDAEDLDPVDCVSGLQPPARLACPVCGAETVAGAPGGLHMNVRAWRVAVGLAGGAREALARHVLALEAGIEADVLRRADEDLRGAVSDLRRSAARIREQAAEAAAAGAEAGDEAEAGAPASSSREGVRAAKVRAATTGLDEAAVAAVGAQVARLGGRLVADPGDQGTTHLLTPSAGAGAEDPACLAKRTMKYCVCVAAGHADVVRVDWVAASLREGRWMPVDAFRVETDVMAAASGLRGGPGRGREAARGERPRLLAGHAIRLRGEFNGKNEVSRRELERVAGLLGADVVNDDADAAPGGAADARRLVVVCSQGEALRGKRASARKRGRERERERGGGVEDAPAECAGVTHVGWGWLLDCAASYTLLPTAGYEVTLAPPLP